MKPINYLSALEVGGVPAFFVNKEQVGSLHVYYIAYGLTYSISPFNEYGEPYLAAVITANSLAGTESANPVINVPVEATESIYLIKQSDCYTAASHLGGMREGVQITGEMPQGVVKVELATEDGVVVGVQSTTLLDVNQAVTNPYYG